jgi:hypothetical protein
MTIIPFIACFIVLSFVNTLFLTLMFVDFGDRLNGGSPPPSPTVGADE